MSEQFISPVLALVVLQSCTSVVHHHLVECRKCCSPEHQAVQCHAVEEHCHQDQEVEEEEELMCGTVGVEMSELSYTCLTS